MSVQGYGTKLYYGTVGVEAATQLTSVRDVTAPNLQVDSIDASHMLSADHAREKEPGWLEADDLEATLIFDKAQADTVYDLIGLKKSFKIEWSDGSKLVFSGFFSALQPEQPMDDIVTLNVGFTVSGKPVFTAGT